MSTGPDLPAWCYWLLAPLVLALVVAYRFITADARRSMSDRRQRAKPTAYVRLYSKMKRKRNR
jgi:hypothetical protein